MTVASTYTPPQYAGNGTTVAFAFPYVFFAPSDLAVVLFNTTANTAVTPAPALNGSGPYDFTVTGVQDVATGEYLGGATVTCNTAPPGGYTVTITRSVAPTQNVALLQNGPFPAKTIEGALDRLTMLHQEVEASLPLMLAAPASDPPLNLGLPAAAARAGLILGFDSTGAPIAVAALTGTTAVSSAMVPVIEAASLQTAFDLLAINGGTVAGAMTISGGGLTIGAGGLTVTSGAVALGSNVVSGSAFQISGGTINGTPIGGASAAAIAGTTGTFSATVTAQNFATAGSVTATGNGAFGNINTPGTLTSTSLATLGGISVSASFTSTGAGWEMNTTGTGSFTGNFTCGIDAIGMGIRAGLFVATSDARLKKHARRITDEEGLSWIERVPPRLYQKFGHWEAGFFAQDMARAGFNEILFQMEDPDMPARRNGARGPAGKQWHVQEGASAAYLAAGLRAALAQIEALRTELREARP